MYPGDGQNELLIQLVNIRQDWKQLPPIECYDKKTSV